MEMQLLATFETRDGLTYDDLKQWPSDLRNVTWPEKKFMEDLGKSKSTNTLVTSAAPNWQLGLLISSRGVIQLLPRSSGPEWPFHWMNKSHHRHLPSSTSVVLCWPSPAYQAASSPDTSSWSLALLGAAWSKGSSWKTGDFFLQQEMPKLPRHSSLGPTAHLPSCGDYVEVCLSTSFALLSNTRDFNQLLLKNILAPQSDLWFWGPPHSVCLLIR